MRKYQILAVVVIVVCFCFSFLLPTGGVVMDSLSYFGISTDFPELKTNLFPLGFPALIWVFQQVIPDYFWASKFVMMFLMILVLLFSYLKQFYFKETLLLIIGKTCFFSYTFVLSEGFFLTLLYFLIYCFHQRFTEKLGIKKFLCFSALLMAMMFSVRYSAIYVYLAIGLFWVFSIFKFSDKCNNKIIFQFLLISGLGIGMYLGFNYFVFGSFVGEHLRGEPVDITNIDVVRNFFGAVNVFDPYIFVKPASNSFGSLGFQFLLMLLDLALLIYFVKIINKKKDFIAFNFHAFLWMIALVYTLSLLVSGVFQQIEELNTRMLAAANFCLYFSFLIVYFKNLKSDKIIWCISIGFLVFTILYSYKDATNYLNYKEEIAVQMTKFKDKKYLINNEKEETIVTQYKIPFINKSFDYQHQSHQKGSVKLIIAGTINPRIKWLKQDTVTDKSKVLYTSQLILK